MPFDKGHEKLGGRKPNTPNKVTQSIRALLNAELPEDDLRKLWKKYLYNMRCSPPLNDTETESPWRKAMKCTGFLLPFLFFSLTASPSAGREAWSVYWFASLKASKTIARSLWGGHFLQGFPDASLTTL